MQQRGWDIESLSKQLIEDDTSNIDLEESGKEAETQAKSRVQIMPSVHAANPYGQPGRRPRPQQPRAATSEEKISQRRRQGNETPDQKGYDPRRGHQPVRSLPVHEANPRRQGHTWQGQGRPAQVFRRTR